MHTSTAPPEPLLLSARDLSSLLGVSTRSVWRLRDSGNLPPPIQLGRLVRWRRAAIDRWLEELNSPRR